MKYDQFIFESYSFDADTGKCQFNYSFDEKRFFTEKVRFGINANYDEDTLERAIFLAFIVAGISYYKTFATKRVLIKNRLINRAQASFFTTLYREGLSQFIYENNLEPSILPIFVSDDSQVPTGRYDGEGVLVLQSGGKDSLLLASILEQKNVSFTPWYLRQSQSSPEVLNSFKNPLRLVHRQLDNKALQQATNDGAYNGHVPVTYITMSYALIDAILHNENKVCLAIGQEGEEPHDFIGDYAINHQWSKTWQAEQLMANYVHDNIAAQIQIGSPLRPYTELKITQLFVENAWDRYGHSFSSCNLANYKQDHINSQLAWCNDCPKCANSFLLFAAWLDNQELESVIGQNLYLKPELAETFKGLLGIDGIIKPFECVGEVSELRLAYHLSLKRGYEPLPFDVPVSDSDFENIAQAQAWAKAMLQ